jgi:hypothetical protein
MVNVEFVLSREQRDEIMKAVKAIEHQVKKMAEASDWPAAYVIANNLTIIQSTLNSMPRVSSN